MRRRPAVQRRPHRDIHQRADFPHGRIHTLVPPATGVYVDQPDWTAVRDAGLAIFFVVQQPKTDRERQEEVRHAPAHPHVPPSDHCRGSRDPGRRPHYRRHPRRKPCGERGLNRSRISSASAGHYNLEAETDHHSPNDPQVHRRLHQVLFGGQSYCTGYVIGVKRGAYVSGKEVVLRSVMGRAHRHHSHRRGWPSCLPPATISVPPSHRHGILRWAEHCPRQRRHHRCVGITSSSSLSANRLHLQITLPPDSVADEYGDRGLRHS